MVKGTTNVALIADLVLKSSEDKENIDNTDCLVGQTMKANRKLLVLLGGSQLGIGSETSGGIEASNFVRFITCMLICVLKKSSLLTLCLETTSGDDNKDIRDDNKVTHIKADG